MIDKWGIFALVAVGIFMSTLDSSIVNIALPAIMKDLGARMAVIEWVVLIYLLTISSLLLTFGRLSDIKGRRWVYCRGFLVFSLGSCFCAAAKGVVWLIAARSFQGVGAAMLMACSPALVVDAFPAAERGKALGMVGTVVAAGLMTGPALGGLILKLLSWRAIFYVNIPIGAVTAAVAWRMLKGGPGDIERGESFDWAGALLILVCFSTFLVALSHSYEWGIASLKTGALLGVSGGAVVWLVRIETRTPFPVFDPGLLKIRLFILPIVSAMILFAGLFTIVFLMPFFLVHPSGRTVDQAAYTMVIPFVFLFFVSPLSGALSDRMGSRLLCTVGMGVLAAALFSLAMVSPAASFVSIAWRLALAGVGTAVFISPNSAVAMGAVPYQRRGVAAGTVATARNLGMMMGVALAGLIFNSVFRMFSGGDGLRIYQPALAPWFMGAFHAAMAAGGILAVTGIGVAFFRGPEK